MTTFKQVSLIFFSCFALVLTITTSTSIPIEGANNNEGITAVAGALERLLQNEFLNKQINASVGASPANAGSQDGSKCEKDALYKYMDNLAIKLSQAISNRSTGLQLLRELQEAINMVDLLKVAGTSAGKMVSVEKKQTKYNNLQAPSRGLLVVLDDDNNNQNNEHIVHSDKKLSAEALKELEVFAQNSETFTTEKFIQFYSDPKWNRHNNQYGFNDGKGKSSEKIQAVKDFLIQAFDTGASLADRLYLSSGFVEQLPIIGNEITKLKQKGQAVYDLIRTIRSFKTFMDIYRSGHQAEVKFEGKQMLGEAGLDALKYVALNMLKSYTGIDMNPGNINEIAGRTAYYLLIQFAPHSNKITCVEK